MLSSIQQLGNKIFATMAGGFKIKHYGCLMDNFGHGNNSLREESMSLEIELAGNKMTSLYEIN